MESISGTDADKKFCKRCRKKSPPVYTELKLGININEYRWRKKILYCDDCQRELQQEYRENYKGIWSTYEREKEEIELEQFEREWNDPEFKRVKEISDKIVRVWNKYGRRKPNLGLQRDLICSVIFPDEWNVSIAKVVEDLLKTRKDSITIQNRHKEILFLYIPTVMNAFREEYRRKARSSWESLAESVNHKYGGHEKLVVRPYHKDEKTKRVERRWYLLSYEEELKQRDEINKNKKDRIDYNMGIEQEIVRKYEQRQVKEEFEDAKTEKESDKDKEGKKGDDQ